MNCPYCEAAVEDDVRRCARCDTPLREECAACRRLTSIFSERCDRCAGAPGFPIARRPEPPVPPAPPPKDRAAERNSLIGCGASLLRFTGVSLLVLAVLCVVMSKEDWQRLNMTPLQSAVLVVASAIQAIVCLALARAMNRVVELSDRVRALEGKLDGR